MGRLRTAGLMAARLGVGVFVAAALVGGVWVSAGMAQEQARYASWGVDEYEFFGLTKPQLTAKFKLKIQFREDFKRACVAPQNGLCAGYDGPTFELTFENGKVAKVQRIFVGCKETQYGPVLESKDAALKYFVNAMNDIARTGTLRPDEVVKLKAARSELSTPKTIGKK